SGSATFRSVHWRKTAMINAIVSLTCSITLLFLFLRVCQLLLKRHLRWWLIKQDPDLLYRAELSCRLDKDLMRCRRRSTDYLHDLADLQARRVNAILPGRKDRLPDLHVRAAGYIFHFQQITLT